MPLGNLFKKVADKFSGGFLSGAADVISKFVADPTEKVKAMQELETLKIQHEEFLASTEKEIELAYLKDMDSARNMQIEALKQEDKFSKRFIYYFTIGLTFCTLVYDFLFFFIQYPERNHDIVNMVAGVLNTGCLISIINFFYGSSKSSEKKQEVIENVMRNNGTNV